MSLPTRLADALRAARADRVLWIILSTSSARSLGRGLLISLTTLYFTRILGIPITTVGTVLFIAASVGAAGSYLGGIFADRWPARLIVGISFFVEAAGFAGYALVPDASPRSVVLLTIFESAAMGANAFGHTALAAVVARGFTGAQRVRTQAWMRTVTNAGIAVGSGFAAIPLALDTPIAYRASLLVAAAAYVLAGLSALRLPASVDARSARADDDPDDTATNAKASSPSPWRNPRFILLSIGGAMLITNFAVTDVAHPQWISAHTTAPPALVSVLLIVNTLIVVALQVPSSRFTQSLPSAGRLMVWAGAAFLLAAVTAWFAEGQSRSVAVVVMLVAAVIHALGEVASASALWALSFGLTPRDRAGQYQGMSGLFVSIGFLAAPLLITRTALQIGLAGWLILGGVIAAGCLLAMLATRGAEPADADAAGQA